MFNAFFTIAMTRAIFFGARTIWSGHYASSVTMQTSLRLFSIARVDQF
jgi:hypothetical protein